MADDLMIGFNFFTTRDGVSIANEAAQNAAMDQLNNEIARFAAFDKLGQAVESVQAAAERKARTDVPEWEDNVPPDFSDDFDFLL